MKLVRNTYRLIGFIVAIWLYYALPLAAQSPMATGRWAKIEVERSGLHVLTEQDAKAMGMERLDQVRVWGYGGRLLPEQIRRIAGRGLQEVPTYLHAGKLYFYAEGTTTWQYDATHAFFYHTTNHYARHGSYLISEGGTPRRMEQMQVTESAPSGKTESNLYTDLLLHEVDLVSPSHSGRKLYGESMQANPRLSFSHRIEGLKSLRMRFSFMAYPQREDSKLSALISGKPYTDLTITAREMSDLVSFSGYKIYGIDRTHLAAQSVEAEGDQVQIDFVHSAQGTISHFDYYEINAERTLRYRGTQLPFTRALSKDTPTTTADYTIDNAEGLMLFALNTPNGVQILRTSIGTSSVNLALPAQTPTGEPCHYLALSPKDAYKPRLSGRIGNQSLLDIAKTPDLLIITTNALLEQAERLSTHYKGKGYDVVVATQTQIFNEYNGGTPDATAYRIFARQLYDRYKEEYPNKSCPMQILFVGDGAHDNRKISAPWQAADVQQIEFLLSYQSVSSLDLSSYTSDDYFGVLADEAVKTNRSTGQETDPALEDLPMDVGVGRLPVRTPAQARAVIDKIIGYEAGNDHGSWRMRATFVADNGDGNSHTRQSIHISNQLESQAPALQLRKIYMSAYPRVNVGGRTTVPGAHKALLESLNEGALIINYNGHGGPQTWADEHVLSSSDIQSFTHTHLPLWITATCDFAGFDAISTSAGEEILLHPTSGGVALLSTTRVVWDIPNQLLNMAVLKELFTPNESGEYRPLGEVIRDAKNSLRLRSTPENRLNFILLGSPLTRIAMPRTDLKVGSISGKDVDEANNIVELRALEEVKLEGYVQRGSGEIDGDFSGKLEVWVYDGEEEVETVDNFDRRGSYVAPTKYKDYRNIIYKGQAQIENGRYNITFIIPKDVAYSGEKGRISLYGYDSKRQIECVGLSHNFVIRTGDAPNIDEDNEGPEIKSLTLSGQDVGRRPTIPTATLLEAVLRDKSSINLSSAGLGHRITLIIDNLAEQTYDLNNYYVASADNKGEGVVRFRLEGLRSGRHHATLLVWDVHNNVTKRSFSFDVQPGLLPHIEQVQLRYTPDSNLPHIIVEHNQIGAQLTATLKLYNMVGQLIWHSNPTRLSSSSSIESIPLSLPDALQARLPNGMYIVQIVLSGDGEAATQRSLKWIKN